MEVALACDIRIDEIQAGRTMVRSQALPIERELFIGLFDTEDQSEGVNVFLGKRKADWKNC